LLLNGETLKRLRGFLNYSQEQFADLMEVSVMQVSRYERGVHTLTPKRQQLLMYKLNLTPEKIAKINSLYYELGEVKTS